MTLISGKKSLWPASCTQKLCLGALLPGLLCRRANWLSGAAHRFHQRDDILTPEDQPSLPLGDLLSFMVGRPVGYYLMKYVAPRKLLGIYADQYRPGRCRPDDQWRAVIA
jgi:hypothetical protein